MNKKSSKPAIRMTDGIGVETEEHKPAMGAGRDTQATIGQVETLTFQKLKHGAAWPRTIDYDVMRGCDERWVDFRVPENYGMAIIKSLLAIAQLQTHDPVVLQRYIGYPLRFLGSLVNNLIRLEEWFTEDGYLALIQDLETHDDARLDSALLSIQESVLRQNSPGVIDLAEEWYRCTGVPIGAY
jgi:hypothetical protein